MQFRLALALFASVLLIGTASWYRFTSIEYRQPEIIAVGQGDPSADYEDVLREFTTANSNSASSTLSNKPLSSTGVISRNLVLDYVSLAASGQASESSIINLANKYVESVPTLNQAPTISYADIKTVSDTKSNFQSYTDQFMEIHKEYENRVAKAYAGEQSLRTLNPALYSLASAFSIAYTDAAVKLQKTPVPASLATLHFQLINSYLSSAAAMEAVSKANQDSGVAFAGLVALNENLNKEDLLYVEINNILTANGI